VITLQITQSYRAAYQPGGNPCRFGRCRKQGVAQADTLRQSPQARTPRHLRRSARRNERALWRFISVCRALEPRRATTCVARWRAPLPVRAAGPHRSRRSPLVWDGPLVSRDHAPCRRQVTPARQADSRPAGQFWDAVDMGFRVRDRWPGWDRAPCTSGSHSRVAVFEKLPQPPAPRESTRYAHLSRSASGARLSAQIGGYGCHQA